MGLPFAIGLVGLVFFGTKVLGGSSKKKNLWYGAIVAKVNEAESVFDMAILDPNQPGSFPVNYGGVYATDKSSVTNVVFAPLAFARVRYDGKSVTVNKTGDKMAVGKIIMIINYEMSPKPSGRPVVGDTVLFD